MGDWPVKCRMPLGTMMHNPWMLGYLVLKRTHNMYIYNIIAIGVVIIWITNHPPLIEHRPSIEDVSDEYVFKWSKTQQNQTWNYDFDEKNRG